MASTTFAGMGALTTAATTSTNSMFAAAARPNDELGRIVGDAMIADAAMRGTAVISRSSAFAGATPIAEGEVKKAGKKEGMLARRR